MSAHSPDYVLFYHQLGNPYSDYSIDYGVRDTTNHLTDHGVLPSEPDHFLQIPALQRQSLALLFVDVLRTSHFKSTFTGCIFLAWQNGRALTWELNLGFAHFLPLTYTLFTYDLVRTFLKLIHFTLELIHVSWPPWLPSQERMVWPPSTVVVRILRKAQPRRQIPWFL